jgi:hypothetical protein
VPGTEVGVTPEMLVATQSRALATDRSRPGATDRALALDAKGAAPVALALFDQSGSAAGRRTDGVEGVMTDAIGRWGASCNLLAGARKEGLTSV